MVAVKNIPLGPPSKGEDVAYEPIMGETFLVKSLDLRPMTSLFERGQEENVFYSDQDGGDRINIPPKHPPATGIEMDILFYLPFSANKKDRNE